MNNIRVDTLRKLPSSLFDVEEPDISVLLTLFIAEFTLRLRSSNSNPKTPIFLTREFPALPRHIVMIPG